MSTIEAVTDLILETFRLNGRLLAAGDALVRDLDLTSARWQVLGAAMLSAEALPVSRLARTMGLSRQNVQRIVNELEAQGIVRLEPNPHHQRAKLVVPTTRGRALYAEASARQAPWAASLAEGLAPEAIEAATAVLRVLRQRLEQGHGGDGEP